MAPVHNSMSIELLEENAYTYYKDVLSFDDLDIQWTKYLKLFHLNIRSLNKNHDALSTLLSSLCIDFDIIVLSEIWVYNLELYHNLIPSYSFHFSIDPTNQASGIGIYVANKLSYSCSTQVALPGCEYLQVTINLHCNTTIRSYILHCIYRHPGPIQVDFLNDLEGILQNNRGIRDQIVGGDLNINILDKTQHATNAYLNILSDHSFLPLILSPTRVSSKSSTLIDHIMYSGYNGTSRSYSGNILIDISDHFPNYAFLPLPGRPTKRNAKDRPMKRFFSNQSVSYFTNEVANIQLHPDSSVNDTFNQFHAHFQKCFDKCFPLRRVSIKRHKMKAWMNAKILKNTRKKNMLYKKWLVSSDQTDKDIYLQFKKKTEKEIYIAKREYFQNAMQAQQKPKTVS